MNCVFMPLSESHRRPVVDIFNFFVENGFAAYPEDKVPDAFFDLLLKAAAGYPAVVIIDQDASDQVAGFALMRPYHPVKTFERCAAVSYFLLPPYTHRGLGQKIIAYFMDEARQRGIDTLLADISSLNEASIRFHEKMGFEHCGRFRRIGRKRGRDFDVVWMQKLL